MDDAAGETTGTGAGVAAGIAANAPPDAANGEAVWRLRPNGDSGGGAESDRAGELPSEACAAIGATIDAAPLGALRAALTSLPAVALDGVWPKLGVESHASGGEWAWPEAIAAESDNDGGMPALLPRTSGSSGPSRECGGWAPGAPMPSWLRQAWPAASCGSEDVALTMASSVMSAWPLTRGDFTRCAAFGDLRADPPTSRKSSVLS